MKKLFLGLMLPILILFQLSVAQGEGKLASWIDYWRNATVAIGRIQEAEVKQSDGKILKKKIFVIVGTGVILGFPEDASKTPWLVTAKHVFFDPSKKWEPDNLQIRFSWFDERAVDEYLGIRIDLKKDGKKLWVAHPTNNVDLACVPLVVSKEEAGRDEAPGVPIENFATAVDIFEGAPVIVLGYPGAVGPSFWSRAIARQGIISWVSPNKPELNLLLIDSNVFPGNSGGPVFKLPTGTDRHGNFVVGGKVAFLGIISEGRTQELPLTAGGKEIQIQGEKGPQTLLSANFIGIGVVEPAARVKELLSEAAKSATQR